MIKITYNPISASIEIRFPYDAGVVLAVKRAFGGLLGRDSFQRNGHDKFWNIPNEEGEGMRARVEAFQNEIKSKPVEISDLVWQAIEVMEHYREHNERLSMAREFESDAIKNLGFDLSPVQVATVQYLFQNARGVILADSDDYMTSIVATLELALDFPSLVICREANKYPWGLKWKMKTGRPLFIMDDEQMIYREITGEIDQGRTHAQLCICNFGNLEKNSHWLEGIPWRAVVIDESHFIRNGESMQAKTMRAIAKRTPHRFACSLTDIHNKPWELIPQLDILQRLDSEFGGRNQFLHDYVEQVEGTMLPVNTDHLEKVLRSVCYVKHEESPF